MNNTTATATAIKSLARSHKRWTDQEMAKVAKLAPTHTDQEIAGILGRSKFAISTIRSRKNLGRVRASSRARFFQPDLFTTKPTPAAPSVFRMGLRWVMEMNNELYELVPLKRG